jgi:hypothetical protein
MDISAQLFWVFVLALPVACITWTLTHEELFRETRDWCTAKSQRCRRLVQRKFFYALTCEYCLSHYVAAGVTAVSDFRLLVDDWRGFAIAWLSLVWVANCYMSLFARLRLDIRRERVELQDEQTAKAIESGAPQRRGHEHMDRIPEGQSGKPTHIKAGVLR